MNQNPYKTPESAASAASKEAALKRPMGLMAFQGIMLLVTVLMYLLWLPYLKDAYDEFGLELSVLSRHLFRNSSAYFIFGILAANGLFLAVLAHRKRGEMKQSRVWATQFVVFWILFLVYTALIAYVPVFAIRAGGVNIWL